MRAQQHDSGLKREPGELSKLLLGWAGFGGLLVINLGLWVNIWFIKHARRTTFRGVFDHTRYRPTFPVPSHVRAIQTLVGLFCAGFAALMIAKIIEAHVWEGGGPLPNRPGTVPSGYLLIAFTIAWIGLWMIIIAWRDHVRSLHGTPARKLDAATQEAIRTAVAQGDFTGAVGLYRRAVPEAGMLEAREYAVSCVGELQTANPAGFAELYTNPWRVLRVRPAVLAAAIALVAAAWFAIRPSDSAQVAWYFLGGVLYSVAAMVSMCLRGFLVKFLAFIACSMIVFTGGRMLFEKQLAGHVWLMLVGVATATIVFVLSQRKKKA